MGERDPSRKDTWQGWWMRKGARGATRPRISSQSLLELDAHKVGRPGVIRVQGFSAGWSQAQELQLWAGELRPSASLFVVLSSGNAGQGGEPSHWLEDSLSLGDVPGC